jgi:uncharacterized protein
VPWYVAFGVVVVGFASGVLSGMFGVGGAVLTTPGIRVLGATPIQAVGSTVPAILPGALSGTYRFARAGLVNWRIGMVCGISGALLAVAGAWVAGQVEARWLMVLTAMLLGWSGVSIFRSGRTASPVPTPGPSPAAAVDAPPPGRGSDPPAGTREVSIVVLSAVGAGSGFVAGLLGVGGGVVMMPVFTSVLRLPIKEAVASSLVAVAIFSLPALVAHALLGHVHWGYAALLVVGVVPGAQVGSRFTIGASERTVRLLFGAFLVVLAAVYGGTELVAIVW